MGSIREQLNQNIQRQSLKASLLMIMFTRARILSCGNSTDSSYWRTHVLPIQLHLAQQLLQQTCYYLPSSCMSQPRKSSSYLPFISCITYVMESALPPKVFCAFGICHVYISNMPIHPHNQQLISSCPHPSICYTSRQFSTLQSR